ncbi:MAG: ATPase, partial [Herbinix sp.]|nr:ATPase [Herbinix sp.]
MESNLINKRRVDIIEGRTTLGIELGSTRIKAVLMDEDYNVIAAGKHDWENRYIDNIWTY